MLGTRSKAGRGNARTLLIYHKVQYLSCWAQKITWCLGATKA